MSRLMRSLTVTVGVLGTCGVIALSAASVGAKGSGRADSGVVYAAITH